MAQGWKDTGIHFTVTQANSLWLQSLDGMPTAEAYAHIFGVPARQWALPPLAQLARLYPLGLEISAGHQERIIRSPLQVEADGSFRMNAGVADGEIAHLMVGDAQACLENTRLAARKALAGSGKFRPVLALVFIDLAWQMLFVTRPDQIEAALREEIGEIPFIGAFTLGQVAQPPGETLVRFFNQSMVIAVIGED